MEIQEPLYLYNSRQEKKENFTHFFHSIRKNNPTRSVHLYTCGPTVYNYAHIGNLRTYIFTDLLKRVLNLNQWPVYHIMNITDVGHLSDDGDEGEDKVIKAARERGLSVQEIALMFTQAFQSDYAKLQLLAPQLYCPASHFIPDIIQWIAKLDSDGYIYINQGNVFFNTQRLKHYTYIFPHNKNKSHQQARVDTHQGKRHPNDFVLWFTQSKFERQSMLWDSPWGRGYPGWHSECAVIAYKYFQSQLDIHCGGIDHLSIHHPNEIAHVEALYPHLQWGQFWLHSEFLILNQKKMSKSEKNIFTLTQLLEKNISPLSFKYYCHQAHYRSQLIFSLENLYSAQIGLNKILTWLNQYRESSSKTKYLLHDIAQLSSLSMKYTQEFICALNDDLNTPVAWSIIFHVFRHKEIHHSIKLPLVSCFLEILGFWPLPSHHSFLLTQKETLCENIPQEIQIYLDQRILAKQNKNFILADQIRNEVKKQGYQIIDTPKGSYVKKITPLF